MKARRLIFQLRVSRGVNSTTKFRAIVATVKGYIRGKGRSVVIVFLHIGWLLALSFGYWLRPWKMSGLYARSVVARERIL